MNRPSKNIFLILIISVFFIAVPALVAVGVAYMLTRLGVIGEGGFWVAAAVAFVLQQIAVIADSVPDD